MPSECASASRCCCWSSAGVSCVPRQAVEVPAGDDVRSRRLHQRAVRRKGIQRVRASRKNVVDDQAVGIDMRRAPVEGIEPGHSAEADDARVAFAVIVAAAVAVLESLVGHSVVSCSTICSNVQLCPALVLVAATTASLMFFGR